MPITELIPPGMAAISHGFALPVLALLLSLALGAVAVVKGGYGASALAGLPLAFSAYWTLSAAMMRTEIPPAGYAQVQKADDAAWRRIVAARMHGGRLTFGDLYDAKSQYDRETGERARRAIAAHTA